MEQFEEERKRLARQWMLKRPARTDFQAWDKWLMDMSQSLERFDRLHRRAAA